MGDQSSFSLFNLQNGKLGFKVLTFEDGNDFDRIHRLNYFSLIWITEGMGTVRVDFKEYGIFKNSLFAFSPYQPFMFLAVKMKGTAICFDPDFFCIQKQQTEVACLFNNIHQLPYTIINENSTSLLSLLIGQMRAEINSAAPAQYEMLVSYLKIFLITVSRLKMEQQPETIALIPDLKEPFILQKLRDRIEKDFREKHTAGDYARTLNISTKTLAKITKDYFNRTLTELIAERIIMEAKRELYMTRKPVKEIAWELGYEDVHYFSRFFKTNTKISPQVYRETVGFRRSDN